MSGRKVHFFLSPPELPHEESTSSKKKIRFALPQPEPLHEETAAAKKKVRLSPPPPKSSRETSPPRLTLRPSLGPSFARSVEHKLRSPPSNLESDHDQAGGDPDSDDAFSGLGDPQLQLDELPPYVSHIETSVLRDDGMEEIIWWSQEDWEREGKAWLEAAEERERERSKEIVRKRSRGKKLKLWQCLFLIRILSNA